jgi:hypothetical protein
MVTFGVWFVIVHLFRIYSYSYFQGNNVTLQAFANIFQVPIFVFREKDDVPMIVSPLEGALQPPALWWFGVPSVATYLAQNPNALAHIQNYMVKLVVLVNLGDELHYNSTISLDDVPKK